MNKNHNLFPFDLQFFADPASQLLNTTGTPGMTDEMKTFYEKRLIDQAEPRLVHDQFADYYPMPVGGGKTIEFRKYDSLPKATTPLTEGVTPDVAGGTNVIYAPKVADDGTETPVTSRADLTLECKLTPKLFFQAAAQLGAMNADTLGDSYVAIIHPYAAYDLKTSKEWIEVHKYADPEAMYRGEIGKLGNIRFIETSEAKIWKDETCPSDGSSGHYAVFGTLVLGAHAYGVTELEGGGLEHIVKQLGYGDDPLNQRASVGWKGMRAAERLVEQYMVRIESLSSYSASAAAN